MSRAQDYLRQIASILERYELVPQVTEEMMQQGCKKLREEPGITTLDGAFLVLEAWMPDRCVRLGSDVHNNEDAAQALRALAKATGGEWRLTDVSATVVSETEEGRMEAIDFVSQGKPMRWQHTVSSQDGVSSGWAEAFMAWLMEFMETSLSGMFWGPLLDNRTLLLCYLPEPAAMELMMVQSQLGAEFDMPSDYGDAFRAFVDAL